MEVTSDDSRCVFVGRFFHHSRWKGRESKKQIDVRQFTQKSINKDSFSQDQATLDNLILADSVAPRSGHNFTVYSDAQRTKPAMILDRETGKTYVESYSAENFDFGPNPRIEIKEMVVKRKSIQPSTNLK